MTRKFLLALWAFLFVPILHANIGVLSDLNKTRATSYAVGAGNLTVLESAQRVLGKKPVKHVFIMDGGSSGKPAGSQRDRR